MIRTMLPLLAAGLLTAIRPAAAENTLREIFRPLSSDVGLSFRVLIDSRGITLGRIPDRKVTKFRLPDCYLGVTDAILTVALEGELAEARTSWTTRCLTAVQAGEAAVVTYGRLSPAVLFEIPNRHLSFLPGQETGPLPQYAAWAEKGRIKVATLVDDQPLDPEEPWLLLWFGERTPLSGHLGPVDVQEPGGVPGKLLEGAPEPLDIPLLVRWEKRPVSVKVSPAEIVFSFSERVGKCAVMPLFGARLFLPKETVEWQHGLPQEILDQCRLWARLLRDIPVEVEESWTWSADQDAVEVHQRFQWVSFEDDWQTPPVKAAPLPPMLALAIETGIPVEFWSESRPVQPRHWNVMETAGSLMGLEGVDEYTWTWREIWKRFSKEQPAPQASPQAQPIIKKLRQAVTRILEAGHLRPLFYDYSSIGRDWYAHFYWVGTPELAYTLAQAWPYLSDDLQTRLASHMEKEWQEYPPFHLDDRYYKEGTWRAPYELPWDELDTPTARPRDEAWRRRNFLLDLYRISVWHDVTGLPPNGSEFREQARRLLLELASHLDWAILGPRRLKTVHNHMELRFMNLQGSAAYNSWLAGAVGVLRLAHRHGWQPEEAVAAYLVAKLAMARLGQACYVRQMYRYGLVRGAPEDDWRAVAHIDEFGTIVRWGAMGAVTAQDQELPVFIDLTEPVGRLLGDYAQAECRQYLRHLDAAIPFWYLSEAPKQGAIEHRTSPLLHLSGNVLAQYWILQRKGDEFRRYVDTSRFLGDLYYLQNLAALIRSYGESNSQLQN